MKKKLTLVLGGISAGWLVWIFLMTLPVLADGGPHSKRTGTNGLGSSCASCHRAHTAQAPELLKEEQPALCYSCHGDTAQGAGNDVEGGVYYSTHDPRGQAGETVSPLRGGGFKYALINTSTSTATGWSSDPANPPINGNIPALTVATRKAATSAHQVDPTVLVTMWGNGAVSDTPDVGLADVSLTCGNCHDPHGNGQYRLLRPIPKGSEAAVGVAIADSTTKNYTTTNYWSVADANAPEFIQKISSWCSTCHTRYLSTSATGSSGDAIFDFRHKTDATAAYAPTCVQCHVAHGSDATASRSAAFAELPGGTEPSVQNTSDSRLLRLDSRGVCSMCHFR